MHFVCNEPRFYGFQELQPQKKFTTPPKHVMSTTMPLKDVMTTIYLRRLRKDRRHPVPKPLIQRGGGWLDHVLLRMMLLLIIELPILFSRQLLPILSLFHLLSSLR